MNTAMRCPALFSGGPSYSRPGGAKQPPGSRPPALATPARGRGLPAFPPPRTSQQHVPSDSFGGRSPERVAADALRSLFTFTAAKIVLAQLEGSGRGSLAAYDAGAHAALTAALLEWPAPPKPPGGGSGEGAGPPPPPAKGRVSGDVWLGGLARVYPACARRVAEVREAYCSTDFEWDSAQRLAVEGTRSANMDIMRQLLYESLAASDGSAEGGGPGSDGGEG